MERAWIGLVCAVCMILVATTLGDKSVGGKKVLAFSIVGTLVSGFLYMITAPASEDMFRVSGYTVTVVVFILGYFVVKPFENKGGILGGIHFIYSVLAVVFGVGSVVYGIFLMFTGSLAQLIN